jgi:hypothetical protein
MYNFIHDPEVAKTWDSRDLQDTEDIDVPARRQSAKRSNIPRQIWVMKHGHGVTGTGKFMKLWGYRSTHKCQDVDTIVKQQRKSLCTQPHWR